MISQELQSMTDAQLNQELSKTKKQLSAMSFDHQQGNLKDTSQLAKMRKNIAHIKTAMNMRNNEAQPEKKADKK